MIRYYCAVDGDITSVVPERSESALWVDLTAPTPEEVELIHKAYGIDLQDVADCLDPNERSRLESEERYDLVVLRSLVKEDRDGDKFQMMPIGVFVTPGKIVTVRIGSTFAPSELTSEMKRKPKMETKDDLFFALVRRINKDIERTVRPMERRMSSIQETIVTARRVDVAHTAFALSNGLILLNTALLSNLNAISMLPRARQLNMTKERLDVAEDLENDMAQLYEMTTIYREIMSNVLNAYESAIANNLSTVMKTLTTISLILILPTLIASLFGMNVELPYSDHPLAFFMVIGLSAIAVAGLWVAFRLKHIL